MAVTTVSGAGAPVSSTSFISGSLHLSLIHIYSHCTVGSVPSGGKPPPCSLPAADHKKRHASLPQSVAFSILIYLITRTMSRLMSASVAAPHIFIVSVSSAPIFST